MKNNRLILVVIFSLIVYSSLSSCSSSKVMNYQSTDTAKCTTEFYYDYTEEELPQELDFSTLSEELTSFFNQDEIYLLHSLELIPKVEKLLELSSTTENLESKLEKLSLKQDIFQVINRSSLEISALGSRIDCEEERAEQVASFLSNKLRKRESSLTVAAIIVGATGAILAGSFATAGTTPEIIGLATGVTEAVFGVLILTNEKKIEFKHQDNILKEFWEYPSTSKYAPASVWYYLNSPNLSEKEISIREQTVNGWKTFADFDEQEELILFGEGGEYTSDLLKRRAGMLDQAEAQIKMMKVILLEVQLAIEKI